ncbi:hypothetical protein BBD32_08325 [Elizabethkingia anophelis]|uniref:HTH luxR-type domain-containing protein n=1 Tax=Elizabethkingia anophelis TaxID=1117645 RepID=A0AAU8V1Q0_9FLAO|nr:hypothetical protein BBD32_08325 [Elizabethkingia anophelis]OPB62110.1 hypothetical protein BAY11_16975 [Elizabethkingia anophelis]
MIFYFSAANGFENGLTFYYFPLILSSIVIFPKGNKKKYLERAIYTVVFILFCVSNIFNFNIFGHRNSIESSEKIRIISFTQVYILLVFISYIIVRNQKIIIRLQQQASGDKKLINRLKKENTNSLKPKINIEELVQLAQDNSPAFIPSFQQSFPYFYENLTQINPSTTNEEFRLCALLKLGFSTRDIATCSGLTIRTVQTKKSRLRNSFNLSSKIDLYNWIDKISS